MNRNRKKIIFIILGIILVVIAVWFFALNTTKKESIVEQTRNLFPFGNISSRVSNLVSQINQKTTGNETIETQGTENGQEQNSNTSRLRQITSFPTGGFVPFVRVEEKQIEDIIIDENGNSVPTTSTIEVENHYVRYTSIDDGTIYETKIDQKVETLETERLADNFIPNAERVFFSPDGSRVIFQYWDNEEKDIESYLGRIEQDEMEIEPCPFVIDKAVAVGDNNPTVRAIHKFLNRNPQTRISSSGLNSPGNESSYAGEATITAIKNFQSLYDLEIDGVAGSGTRAKMKEICNEQQKNLAEQEFAKRDTRYSLSGFFLPQDIISVAMSPTNTSVFYLQKTTEGVIGILRNLVEETRNTIFSSPFSEWHAQWNNDQLIELSTKPSYQSLGYSYTLDSQTGAFKKSLKEMQGLLTLPNHDQSKILVSESQETGIQLWIYDREKNGQQPLGIQTFPEKCVWASDNITLYCAVPENFAYGNEYPDTWYQGLEIYQDSLWKINTETFEETPIVDLVSEFDQSLDISQISIDSKNEYLYFIDKINEHLWSYRISL